MCVCLHPKPPGHCCQGYACQRHNRVSFLWWPFRDVTSYFPPWTLTHVYTHTAPLADAPGQLWSWWQMELAVITSSLTSACSVILCNAQILLCVVCVCTVCACVYTKDCPSSYHTLFHSTSWKWDREEIINNAEEEINFCLVCTQRQAACTFQFLIGPCQWFTVSV